MFRTKLTASAVLEATNVTIVVEEPTGVTHLQKAVISQAIRRLDITKTVEVNTQLKTYPLLNMTLCLGLARGSGNTETKQDLMKTC